MPRVAHEVTVDTVLSYETRMVLALLLPQINALRSALSLPVVTPAQVRAALRQYIREHPRPTTGG